MVIPDFELICEIMLVAEGFIDARLLARKFISLYTLCKELLSKQVLTKNCRICYFPELKEIKNVKKIIFLESAF